MEQLDTKQFILTMRQIAEEKNLPFEVVKDALEQALAAAYRKDYGSRDQNVRASLNIKSGDFRLFVIRDIVKEVTDPEIEIALADAKKLEPKAKIGGTIEEEVKAKSFGRVAAQTAKQVILQRLREAEREVIHDEFSQRVGTVLNGTVQRVEPKVVYIDLGKAQGILPASEQIPVEKLAAGQRLKVYLRDVETSARGPQLVLSRAVPEFISLLFEREVPEMENKAVEIKVIAREAGVRTKLAVASTVPGVDPVGTFVGGHGTRVQAVMNEVGEEKIDIVPFSDDIKAMISNALAPTKITKVDLDQAKQTASVAVPEDQLSVAIGKNGQNVRLASKLTGWQIDIVGEEGKVKSDAAKATVAASAKSAKTTARAKPASKQDLEAALIESVDKSTAKPKTKPAKPAQLKQADSNQPTASSDNQAATETKPAD
ncbi:transcription termination/antitermination protein NusA [Candidatus Microgenomates bacterium]|nr:transcription termination/antitermination protein NusA [Candidatus Microgenomates bacterium]